KTRLDMQKTENEMMGGLMGNVTDQASWDAVKPLVGRIDPDFLKVAGDTYDETRFNQYKKFGTTIKEQHEFAEKALDDMSQGRYQKAIANAVAATHPGENLDETRMALGKGLVPQSMIDAAIPAGSVSSPELIKRLNEATLTEKERQDIAEKIR